MWVDGGSQEAVVRGQLGVTRCAFCPVFLAGEPKPSTRRVRLRVCEDARNTYIVPGESPDMILTSTRLESSTLSNPRGRIMTSQECRWELSSRSLSS